MNKVCLQPSKEGVSNTNTMKGFPLRTGAFAVDKQCFGYYQTVKIRCLTFNSEQHVVNTKPLWNVCSDVGAFNSLAHIENSSIYTLLRQILDILFFNYLKPDPFL